MNTSRAWDTRYEWQAVTLLSLGFGLVGLDRMVIAPLAPAIMGDLHLTPQDINNLMAVLGTAWGLAAMFMGGLSDRIGRRKVLIPTMVIFSLLSVFSGLATGLVSLLVIRAVMGLSEGTFNPTSFASTAEASLPKRRGFNQGLQESSFSLIGLGFGPIIATQLLFYMSWRGVFMLVAIPGLILAVLMAMVIREPVTVATKSQGGDAHRPVVKPASLRQIFAHRNVPLAMLATLCVMCGVLVLTANVPIYLISYLHLSQTDMGFVMSGIGFGGFLGQWGLATLSDYLGRKIVAILGFVLSAVFVYLFAQVGADVTLLFILFFLGGGIAFGVLALFVGPIAVEAAPIGRVSTVAGIIIGTGEIFGGGIGTAIAGGIAAAYGIQYTFYMALLGLLAGVIVSLFLQETAPRKVGHAVSDLDKLEEKLGGSAILPTE